MFRFFLWVYLRTGVEESVEGDFASDKLVIRLYLTLALTDHRFLSVYVSMLLTLLTCRRLWQYLEGVRQTLINATKSCRSDSDVVQQMLQRRAHEQ